MTKSIITIFLLLLHLSCNYKMEELSVEQWKNEILETEKRFADMAKSSGIREAFLFYAADHAALERNNVLHIGKQSISDLFSNSSSNLSKVELSWQPDFVDVASSGDLGYTYGKYNYIVTDSAGIKTETQGIFHTVWKRQADGSWKYVWD